MDTFSLDKIKHLSQTQWLMVAGAAAAGLLFLKSMVMAAVAGGATLAYVVSKAPCCDNCAAGQSCGGTQPYSVDEVSQAAPAVAANQPTDAVSGGDAGDGNFDGMFE